MYQGQGLELREQRKIPSGSDLAYGMKKGAALVLTTNNSKFGGYGGGPWQEEGVICKLCFTVNQ